MKKMFWLTLLFVSMTATAQKDVTKFLGIPVDGTKSSMIQKLKTKGFRYNDRLDYLTGEFNGRDVRISVVTNNNKVWRIVIEDEVSSNETDIRIRFNNLCRQFEKNEKYVPASFSDCTISSSEDISYEIMVNNKRYEAAYYQMTDFESSDSLVMQKKVKDALLAEYTQEQIDNFETLSEELQEKMYESARKIAIKMALDVMSKKSVWFMINERYGRYRIIMYYDNEYNRSDGEDL
ncbi:MAG: hypothetical protein IKS94_02890 [Prevotella sp.]|nr:hypothetical protein [Prevotella sp.]